jgi:hypothetical protein
MVAGHFDALTHSLQFSGPASEPGRHGQRSPGFSGLVRQTSTASTAKICKGQKGKNKKMKFLKNSKPSRCGSDNACPDKTKSCLVGCQEVCSRTCCLGCNFCVVRYIANGARVGTRAATATIDPETPCATDAGCSASDVCIRLATFGNPIVPCLQSDCGVCGTFSACA